MYSFKVSLEPTQLLSKCRLFESSPCFSLGFVLIGTRRSRNNNRAREKLATLRINLEAKNLLPELLKKLEVHQVEIVETLPYNQESAALGNFRSVAN